MSHPLIEKPLQIWTFLSGATDPYKNQVIPSKGTIPMYSQVQTTDAVPVNITVTTDGTDATLLHLSSDAWDDQNIQEGMYVYSDSLVNKRKIVQVLSKSLIKLEYAFQSALAAENLLVAHQGKYRFVRIESVGTADTAKVDKVVALKASGAIILDFPECITYDASGTNESLKFTLGQ